MYGSGRHETDRCRVDKNKPIKSIQVNALIMIYNGVNFIIRHEIKILLVEFLLLHLVVFSSRQLYSTVEDTISYGSIDSTLRFT